MSRPKYTTSATDDAILKYKDQLARYDKRLSEYEKYKNQFVGDQGHNRAISLAKDNAVAATQEQQGLAQTAAQQQGLTRAQAAGLAANAVSGNYNDLVSKWYDKAYGTGQDAAAADLNALNATGQQVGNYAQLYNMGQQRDTMKNQISKANSDFGYGIAGTALGTVGGAAQAIGNIGSDENIKNKIKWSDLIWHGKQ